jgi:hypothetical protein
MERATVRPGEHIAVVAVASTDRRAVASLSLSVVGQCLEGDRVESKAAPGPLGLRCRVVDLVVVDHPRNQRRDGRMVEVDVDPTQPGELASAHAGRGDQQPQRVQAVVTDML